jgi:glycosyl-4,4'-diaponeurosporenoate acyltransferase
VEPWVSAVVIDAAVWTLWSAAVGWWQARRPVGVLRHDGPVLRLRAIETRRRYEALGIRRWKRHLPEAGGLFGGLTKRRLPPTAEGGVARFVVECRRAERTHWCILAITPLFALWNPAWLFGVMAAFAAVANLPCLAVLRYNRLRAQALAA